MLKNGKIKKKKLEVQLLYNKTFPDRPATPTDNDVHSKQPLSTIAGETSEFTAGSPPGHSGDYGDGSPVSIEGGLESQ